MEKLISLETAKLAKEKGFDWSCYSRYNETGGLTATKLGMHGNPNNYSSSFSAPTQSILQKWLRDKHGINVISDTDTTLNWIYTIQSLYPQASYVGDYIQSSYVYSTYEEALEKGLSEGLKLIENG